jgi:hypothetical protein
MWGRKIIRFVVGERKVSLVYAYDPRRQGEGRRDPCIAEYGPDRVVPPEIQRQIWAAEGRLSFRLMRWRLKRYGGKLLCLIESGQVSAYGWIQGWGLFRRRFGWLAPEARMLGFYWTAPGRRGSGLYGRLLLHSIAACESRDRMPLLVMTSPQNVSSQKGIEKAGFIKIGTFEVDRAPLGLAYRHRTMEQLRPFPGMEQKA